METSNPAFSKKAVERMTELTSKRAMTKPGTMGKTLLLLLFVVGAAFANWQLAAASNPFAITLMWGGSITALILSFAIIFARRPNPMLIIIYAMCEGLMLGGISYLLGEVYSGIVVRAILLTFTISLAMFGAYSSGLIKPTARFRAGVIGATIGIALFYLVILVLSLFGIVLPAITIAGPWAIGIAGIIVVVAALNLVLDLDFIDKAVAAELPEDFEWYGAFGLMVTLVWLYISILRLLAVINNSR